MKGLGHLVLVILTGLGLTSCSPSRVAFKDVRQKSPSAEKSASPNILVSVIVRNHAHSLPTFLATLETLKCPNKKKKCDLWLIFDNCTDNSYDLFIDWLSNTRMTFDTIIMLNTKNDEKTKLKHTELDPLYFAKNIKKRALKYALDRNFSYVFFLNADTILTNPDTIRILIDKRKPIVAPMLTSTFSQTSTFWTQLDKSDADEVKDAYEDIYSRRTVGCFKTIGLHESYLLDLNDKRVSGLLDDLEGFETAFGRYSDDIELNTLARYNKILLHVCNRETYGYVPDLNPNNMYEESELFVHLRSEHLLNGPNKTYLPALPKTAHLTTESETASKKKPKTRLGFDQIYVINLQRRQDRRERIESALDDLNLAYKVVKAVDAKVDVTSEYLETLGIKVIPDYKDPYNDRSINYGEIGCFLSHYFIWKEVVEKKLEKVIVLEDDARFAFNFKSTLRYLINEMGNQNVTWELLYLGRKLMREYSDEEVAVKEVKARNGYGVVYPSYTHWTVAYALTLDGATKLVDQEPLKKILPVDEYLPIMFNKQPNEYWNKFFPNRDLVAMAVSPPIVSPTHYTGEPSHVSDTEYTPVIDTAKFETEKPADLAEQEDKEDEEAKKALFKEVKRTNIEL